MAAMHVYGVFGPGAQPNFELSKKAQSGFAQKVLLCQRITRSWHTTQQLQRTQASLALPPPPPRSGHRNLPQQHMLLGSISPHSCCSGSSIPRQQPHCAAARPHSDRQFFRCNRPDHALITCGLQGAHQPPLPAPAAGMSCLRADLHRAGTDRHPEHQGTSLAGP